MVIFGIAVLMIYSVLNSYIILRGWNLIVRLFPGANKTIYLVVMIILALAYLMGMFFLRNVHTSLSRTILYIGSIWLFILMYAFLYFLAMDVLKWGISHFKPVYEFLLSYHKVVNVLAGTVFGVLLLGLSILGYLNARSPVYREYDVSIAKSAENTKTLKIVMFSDIHLGQLIGRSRLNGIVEKVNAQNPDIVLIGGDLIDGDYEPYLKENMGEEFKKIKSKYGVYGIVGNHEYFGRNFDTSLNLLKNGGITMLVDETALVANRFYIVGRNDKVAERFSNKSRKPLSDLVAGLDKTKPIILLDHQPFGLEDARQNGIDLQFSGHTHKGQIWPGSLIADRVFELKWGTLKKGDTTYIVSSGIGTWGPPIRIGSRPEIVVANVKFQ